MAIEKRVRKTRMYEPWGYREEDHYSSNAGQLTDDLEKFFANVVYDSDDKHLHFYNKDNEEKVSIDVTEFSASIIESTSYDPVTKILTIKFTNGDKIEINLGELIDENEFGYGFIVQDGVVNLVIDPNGEPYLSVGENGIKISGINQRIEEEVQIEKNRATEVENALYEKIIQVSASVVTEKERAISAETIISASVVTERERAISAETELAEKIEELDTEGIADVDYVWNSSENTMELNFYDKEGDLKDSVELFDTTDSGEIKLGAGTF